MKTTLLLAALVALVFSYFHDSPAPSSAVGDTIAARPASRTVVSPAIVIAPAPSYADRWKTGPYAQTDLKTGPNAQVDFAPFSPNEQATWNETPGYTIISGVSLRR